jgi:hypothetical protein
LTEQVQLQLLIPELTLGTNPLDWAPATKQPRKPREANFLRMCEKCGADIPGTGWKPGDLCGECIEPSWLAIPDGAVCGELFKKRRCACPHGACQTIPF